jgi:hypothetical protein
MPATAYRDLHQLVSSASSATILLLSRFVTDRSVCAAVLDSMPAWLQDILPFSRRPNS